MNTIKRREKLASELLNKEYRDAFVSEHIDTGIPFQIRALREQRGWTQKELANRAGVTQVWISKVENPNHSGFSIKTLLKLASAFDIGLIVRFVPISNLVKWELDLSPDALKAVSFDEDHYFREISQEKSSVTTMALASFLSPEDPLDNKITWSMPSNRKIPSIKNRQIEDLSFQKRNLSGIRNLMVEAMP